MKTRNKALVFSALVLVVLLIWVEERRSFYSNPDGEYVTVWKRIGGTCYVIPGKYYGIMKPSDNYIETENVSIIDLYWCDQLNNTVIVRSERDFKIRNEDKSGIVLEAYDSSQHRGVLYGEGAKRYGEVNEGVSLIELFIKEDYAIDGKTGLKLHD